MKHLLVSLDLGAQTIDLAIPADLTSSDVLAWLAATGRWDEAAPDPRLEEWDGNLLDPDRSLAACGILDGATLLLRSPDPAPIEIVEPPCRPALRPSIPEPLSLADRATVVFHAIGGSDRRWRSVAEAWRWTNHERRLSWLIGRPRVASGVIIRVTGHRSLELAGWLASAFGSVRPEPTLVVEPVSDDREGTARDGRDRLILIDLAPGLDRTARDEAHRQTVVSTIGSFRPAEPEAVVAWWGDGHPDETLDGLPWMRISEDPIASLELAALLAGSWR